jgi:hypothetical protein
MNSYQILLASFELLLTVPSMAGPHDSVRFGSSGSAGALGCEAILDRPA